MIPLRRVLWAALAAALVMTSAAARPAERHALWEVHGAKNTVYLLGSIHLLRPQDSELPAPVIAAYQRSHAVLMELDPRDLAADLLQPELARLMLLLPGQTLDTVVGPRLYTQAQQRAIALGLGRDALKFSQPWYAATTIDVSYLMRLGFDPDAGVDRQVARLAGQDNKPIVPLETAREQLGFFAAMSLEKQRAYLRDALRDLADTPRDASATVRAWRSGDVAAMERDLRRSSRRSPDLHRVLVSERNRRWLPQILDLLDDDHDYLVVVGAMHIIGRDGLLDLLRQHGFNASQQ